MDDLWPQLHELCTCRESPQFEVLISCPLFGMLEIRQRRSPRSLRCKVCCGEGVKCREVKKISIHIIYYEYYIYKSSDITCNVQDTWTTIILRFIWFVHALESQQKHVLNTKTVVGLSVSKMLTSMIWYVSFCLAIQQFFFPWDVRGSIDRLLNCKWCRKFPKGSHRQAPATLPEMSSLEAGVLVLDISEMTHLIEKYMVQSLHPIVYIRLYIDPLPNYAVWLFGICAIFSILYKVY